MPKLLRARRGGRDSVAARHDVLAASYRAMATVYAERETVFAGIMDDRRAWEQATADKRRTAVAADAELRRRHPGQQFAPLRSAEPEPITDAERSDLALAVGQEIPELSPWIKQLAAGRSVFAERLASRRHELRGEQGSRSGEIGPAFASWAELGGQAPFA